ncbi:MAG: PAS domain S-box protein [Planctomycetota bacterium]
MRQFDEPRTQRSRRRRPDGLAEANRALRESEEKYRSLVEHTPDIMMVTDTDGAILFMNRAVPGFTVDEAVGRKVFDYIRPEHHSAVRDCIARVLRTGQPDQYEIVGRGPHGADACYSTRVAPLQQVGKVVGLTMIARDITDQKRAEDALRRSEEEYRAVVEGASQIIARIDRNGVFLFMNQVAARTFGVSANDLIGKTLWDLLPKRAADRQMADIAQVFETGQPLSWQRRSILQGQERWFESTLQPLNGDDGRVRSVLAIASEITERIEAHEKLEQLSQSIIRSQEDLLTHVSRELHDELGQLIMGIDLELETIRKQLAGGKETAGDGIRRAREIVRAATESLRSLCSNLRSPNVDEVGLTSAIESLIRDLRRRTDIDIRCAFSLGSRRIGSNMALALFRIAQEALTNVVRHAEAKQVEVRLLEESGHVILEISDDGRGFDPDPKQVGPGHGLRSIRERTALLGGRLDIESKPGQGARIWVSAPWMPGR